MLSLVNLEKIKERRKILRILGRSLNQLDVMKVSNLVTLELSVLVKKKKKNPRYRYECVYQCNGSSFDDQSENSNSKKRLNYLVFTS